MPFWLVGYSCKLQRLPLPVVMGILRQCPSLRKGIVVSFTRKGPEFVERKRIAGTLGLKTRT